MYLGQGGVVEGCVGMCGRGDEVGVYAEEEGCAGQGDGGAKDEAWCAPVEQIPQGWVREGEGEGELQGRVPWNTAL